MAALVHATGPPGGAIYETFLVPKNSFSKTSGFKVLDGKNGVGTQTVLNDLSRANSQIFNLQSDGEIQLGGQVNGQTICLDVTGAHYANGTAVLEWPCNGGSNQKWNFVSVGSDYYTLSPVGNTKYCLDVTAFGTANGTPIQIYGCNGGSNQAWSPVSAG